jgi:uncharacterized protein (UPF0264 family)
MQLLVSVADASEARAACSGGADVIDAKDPRRGTLGAVSLPVLVAIRDAVDARRAVSAAVGDSAPLATLQRAASAAASLGLAFVKLGFRRTATATAARRAAAAVRCAGWGGRGPREGQGVTRLVLVAYADWRRAGSPAPARLVTAAAESGAAGVLLDTAFKDARLFELVPPHAVGEWIAAAHAAGLFAGVAGSLRGADFATARGLGADLVGVRGAACTGGRTGRVSRQRVAALSVLARAPSPGLAVALV